MMKDAAKQQKPIHVEFDPGFMLESMDMWRKSLDMQIPGRRLLEGFVTRGKAWKIIVRDLKPLDESGVLEDVRREVQVFLGWAEDGLRALDDLAPKTAIIVIM